MRIEFIENDNRIISTEERSHLDDLLFINDEIKKGLGLRNSPMQISGDVIRFNGIAANINFNGIELIVKPKISDKAVNSIDLLMRTLYLRILKTCRSNLNSVIYFTSMSTEDITDDTFIDCIAQYYLDKLSFAMQKLPIVIYYLKEEKRSAIKGKVLIQRELQSPIRDGKTWCRYKMLSRDNEYNALLRWCCNYFADNVSSKSLRFKLNKTAELLEGSAENLSALSVKQMRLPRNFDAYKEPFAIAKDIYLYNNKTTRIRTKAKDICGYVINMETAFENIVCYYAERFSLKRQILHIPQADILFATSNSGKASMDFHIRPDDLLVKDGRKLVMDAKYKYMSLNDKPSREDLYQMVSSCIAHKTNEAILIYPSLDDEDEYSESWKLVNDLNGTKCTIHADKVDIYADEVSLISQIEGAVNKSNFSEVYCGQV